MKNFSSVIVAISFITIAAGANAGMVMTLDDLGTPGVDIILVDNTDGGVGTATTKGVSNTLDGIVVDGVTVYVGSVGTFGVNVTTGQSKPQIGSLDVATLGLNSVTVSTTGAGSLQIMLTDTDFLLSGINAVWETSIQGVAGGTVTGRSTVDANNNEFAIGSGAFAYGSHLASVPAPLPVN